MSDEQSRRDELGAFLRGRRAQVLRSDYGLPAAGRGRTVGLRREEVSYLSGVSVTWYTWLEQGRRMQPSRQVLDAVSRTLRLTPAEHRYLLDLAEARSAIAPTQQEISGMPQHLQRLLDALGANPAFALTPDWRITGYNEAYRRLYPNVEAESDDRNLLVRIFTDPAVRDLLDDWEVTSQQFLAVFRGEVASRLNSPTIVTLIERLSSISPEFRRGWERQDIRGFESRRRRFHHPEHGLVDYEQHQVRPSDRPDFQVVVYTSGPGG